jgi:hypothetical protein
MLWREIRYKNYFRVFELFAGAVFGMLLEIGNIAMSGSYHYNEEFALSIAGVPLAIGLGWSVIIFSAMRISDTYAIKERNRAWMDGLCVFVLDLAIDAVAIRLGFWSWSINYSQEWAGVPYENLIAWVFVGVSFSLTMRYLRQKKNNFRKIFFAFLTLLSPLISYALLLVFLISLGIFLRIAYFFMVDSSLGSVGIIPPLEELYHNDVSWIKGWILFLVTAGLLLAWWVNFRNSSNRIIKGELEILPLVFFVGVHLYFLTVIFLTGLAFKAPFLLIVGLMSFIFHLVYHLTPILGPIKIKEKEK